jgi:hypothetical protein
MEETIIRPESSTGRPPRTIMEVFKMLPETTLAEVINNTLYMSPAPSPSHQRAVKKLMKTLDDFVEAHHLGETFISPIDLFLDEKSNAAMESQLTRKDCTEYQVL